MSDIVVVGTSHGYQAFGNPGAADLEKEIESILDAYNFAAVAEEMSHEGLAKYGATESVCRRAADRRHLRHEYCDPDTQTRIRHGIPPRESIIINGQQSGLSDERIEQRIKDLADSPREKYWLDRLLKLECWPVLFVCGATHVDGFAAKVKVLGRSVRVLHPHWAPPV